eukprot:1349414-Rhodomonas_salina.7
MSERVKSQVRNQLRKTAFLRAVVPGRGGRAIWRFQPGPASELRFRIHVRHCGPGHREEARQPDFPARLPRYKRALWPTVPGTHGTTAYDAQYKRDRVR